MADQQAYNYQFALKPQSGLGVPATGSGATGFDISGGAGVNLVRPTITDPTIRRDGLTAVSGLGMRSGTANMAMVLGVTKQDILWPMVLRVPTWTTIGPFDQTTLTSFTTTTNTIVFTAGQLRTAGLKRGMRVKLAGDTTTANNGKWLSVLGVSVDGRTVTFPTGSLTLNATPRTTITVTVAKFVYSGAAPVDTWSTIEEFSQDILGRTVLQDAKLSKFGMTSGPNAKIIGTYDWIGRDVVIDDATGSALFPNPTYGSGYNMEMSDGFIVKDGVVSNIVTDIGFTYDMNGTVEAVLAPVGRDVSLGSATLSGTISAIRADLSWIKSFKAKTPFEQMIVMQEPESDPIDFLSFYMGMCMPSQPSKNIGASGTTKDAAPFSAGVDDRGGDCAKTMMLVSSSAA